MKEIDFKVYPEAFCYILRALSEVENIGPSLRGTFHFCILHDLFTFVKFWILSATPTVTIADRLMLGAQ